MSPSEKQEGLVDSLWKFLASVKLTIVLLITLACASIVGTLIPQNASPAEYVQAFGPTLYRIFWVLDIFDMYHSWWFQFIILMLAVNIVVCSIDRLAVTWQIIFTKNPKFNPERFQRLSNKQEFNENRSAQALSQIYPSVIARYFRYHTVTNSEKGIYLFAEKGRWTRLGVYVVHLSVVILLIGGLIGSIFGFEGFVNIAEGESAQTIRLRHVNQVRELDFTIRCDDFDVSFYETGTPKEFRSKLTIIEGGQETLTKDIIVNDPLRYKGISIYQASYGNLPPDRMTLKFISNASGMTYELPAGVGKTIDIPEAGGQFTVTEFQPQAVFRGSNLGEAIVGRLQPTGDKSTVDIMLPVRFPSFDKMRKGDWVISVAEIEPRFYTGLQIAKDPGVWVVYTGFILMIVGFVITFFLSHQRICVAILPNDTGSSVTVAGMATKNKLGMENRIRKITTKLSVAEA